MRITHAIKLFQIQRSESLNCLHETAIDAPNVLANYVFQIFLLLVPDYK